MATPIELHFYNKNNEVIKTYSQDRITWAFFKKAAKIADLTNIDTSHMDMICKFVCDFYGNRFTVKKLKKHTDVEQILAVATHIVNRTITIMKEQGVDLPNQQTVKKKQPILYRAIGFLKSRL